MASLTYGTGTPLPHPTDIRVHDPRFTFTVTTTTTHVARDTHFETVPHPAIRFIKKYKKNSEISLDLYNLGDTKKYEPNCFFSCVRNSKCWRKGLKEPQTVGCGRGVLERDDLHCTDYYNHIVACHHLRCPWPGILT